MKRSACRWPDAAALAAAALLVTAAGAAAVDRSELEQKVAEEFGAQVMKVREGTLDGQAVLFVTMMREAGNDNAAFKVDTLPFDAETGEPLRGRMSDEPGSEALNSMRTGMTEKRPDVLRERPWR